MNKDVKDSCLEYINDVRLKTNNFIEKLGVRGDMSDLEIYATLMLCFNQQIAQLIYKSDPDNLRVQNENLLSFYFNTKDVLEQINGDKNIENSHELQS